MEEWTKGLDDLGKNRRSDATRWERWQTAAGVLRMQQDDRGNTDTDKKQILQALSTNLVHHSSLQAYQPNQSTQSQFPSPIPALIPAICLVSVRPWWSSIF